jgi:hypothetical protein
MRTLNAFYDLGTSPASYDFFYFLVAAEAYRVRHKLDEMRVIFVPGEHNGFRDDTLKPLESKQILMRNVVIPASTLFPSVSCVLHLPTRQAAEHFLSDGSEIFPRDYSADRVIWEYLHLALHACYIRGEEVPILSPPPEYQQRATQYVERLAQGKKLVTITLRECGHFPNRGSNISQWAQFIDSLDHGRYFPLVIRDAESVYQSDPILAKYQQCPEASISVLFRTAVYQQSYINCFVANGPIACAVFGDTPTLMMKALDDSSPATRPDWYNKMYGMNVGDERPIERKKNRTVYEQDDCDKILEAFQLLANDLESSADIDDYHGIQNTKQAELFLSTVMEYIMMKFQYSVMQEDIDAYHGVRSAMEKFDIPSDHDRFDLKESIASRFQGKHKEELLSLLDAIARSKSPEIDFNPSSGKRVAEVTAGNNSYIENTNSLNDDSLGRNRTRRFSITGRPLNYNEYLTPREARGWEGVDERLLPHFCCIGAMKAGTTSMYHYLKQHPDIFCCNHMKEPGFFLSEKELYFKVKREIGKDFSSREEAVAYLHEDYGGQKIIGDISAYYAKAPAMANETPAIMHFVNKDLKLIYILRNPVARIQSHYLHTLQWHKFQSKNLHIDDYVEQNYQLCVYTSLYYFQLQRFREYFNDHQIMILTVEELQRSPHQTMAKALNFLGLQEDKSADYRTVHNISDAESLHVGDDALRFSPKIFEKIRQHLEPDTKKMQEYLGYSLDWNLSAEKWVRKPIF